MEVIKKPINELTFDPANVRKHDNRNLDAIKASLNRFGQQKPIVVDTKMVVRAGNGTLAAAKELGWTSINVVVSDLPRADLIAYGIADNRTAELAEWDVEGLTEQLAALDEELRDIAYSDFDLAELDDDTDSEPNEKDDEIPEIDDENPYGVQLGDIWQLGNHRLMCGDSTVKENIDKLMDGQKADMVFTDPPYNLAEKTKGIASSAPTNKQNEKLMKSVWDKEFKVFDHFFDLIDDGVFYVFTSHFLFGDWLKIFQINTDFCGWVVWTKPNPFPSLMKRHWAFDSELCLYGTKGKHKCNYPEKGNARSTWEIPIGEGGLHPTQKPVAVPTRPIEFNTNEGNIVLDLFLGSGSTLIACEKTNRRCFGAEIDPHYCSVILKRWEDYTGEKAIKL